MDLSKSQSGPQSITQFELCESDPKISRKCFNIFMCVACKNNIHPENETAWKQKNSDIKQIEIRDDRGRTTSDIRDGPASVDVSVVEEYQTTLKGVFQLAVNTVDYSFWIGDEYQNIKDVSQMATSLDDSLWLGDRGGNQNGIRLFTSHTGLPKVK
ncbi:RAB33A [Mytilus edulis]|uniref:RAB33A n=1 Tax=Mytilus edulis TaxID=6550 RepID=A0A8S3VF29_MYTED|nr:RAB33A [Mytilus edulis]